MARAKFVYKNPTPLDNRDARNCTVRAIANATPLNYKEAEGVMLRAGRQWNRGHPMWAGIAVMIQRHPEIKASRIDLRDLAVQAGRGGGYWYDTDYNMRYKKNYLMLSDLKKLLPPGNYIATNNTHAFALIDGLVHDQWSVGSTSRIQMLWRISCD